MNYNTETDRFPVKIYIPNERFLAKCDIVSQINSVYNPIEIAGPLKIKLKSTVREIFETFFDWDRIISLILAMKWNLLCNSIINTTLSTPGCICNISPSHDTNKYTLLFFADASIMAIAACAFLKTISQTKYVINKCENPTSSKKNRGKPSKNSNSLV